MLPVPENHNPPSLSQNSTEQRSTTEVLKRHTLVIISVTALIAISRRDLIVLVFLLLRALQCCPLPSSLHPSAPSPVQGIYSYLTELESPFSKYFLFLDYIFPLKNEISSLTPDFLREVISGADQRFLLYVHNMFCLTVSPSLKKKETLQINT